MAAPPKTGNRRRSGHKSCEACRVLKARCVRLSENEPCRRCKRRGEECVIHDWRRPPPRTGTRIELARTLFGESDDQSTSWSAAGSRSTSVTWDDDPVLVEEISVAPAKELSIAPVEELFIVPTDDDSLSLFLSEMSAESGLRRDETLCWMSSHLVEEYFIASVYPLPLGRWRDFRAQFEQAGRRPDQLNSPMAEVLALALMASGALVTNAPCVLGGEGSASGPEVTVNRDLTSWGQRRANVCDGLAERAMRLADERSVFRHESAESITVLLVLSAILDHGDVSRRRGRSYRIAAYSHARTIAEDKYPEQDYVDLVGGVLGWMIYLDDSWNSASAGTAPMLNEADLRLLCPNLAEQTVLPDLDVVSRALNGEGNVWTPVRRIWIYIANLARQLTPYLRQRPDDSELAVIAMNGLDRCTSVIGAAYAQLDEHKKMSTSLHALLSQFLTFRRPGYGLLRYYVLLMPLGRMIVTFYIDRAIKAWIQTTSREQEPQPEFRLSALTKLKQASDVNMFERAREFAQLFRSVMSILPTPTSLALASGIRLVYEMLPMYADSLCAIPTQEDNYPTYYTLQQKREEIVWFTEALYALGGVYADSIISEATAIVEKKLAQLDSRLTRNLLL